MCRSHCSAGNRMHPRVQARGGDLCRRRLLGGLLRDGSLASRADIPQNTVCSRSWVISCWVLSVGLVVPRVPGTVRDTAVTETAYCQRNVARVLSHMGLLFLPPFSSLAVLPPGLAGYPLAPSVESDNYNISSVRSGEPAIVLVRGLLI